MNNKARKGNMQMIGTGVEHCIYFPCISGFLPEMQILNGLSNSFIVVEFFPLQHPNDFFKFPLKDIQDYPRGALITYI